MPPACAPPRQAASASTPCSATCWPESSSVDPAGKGSRRRIALHEAVALDFQHREAALDLAALQKEEDAVDDGETAALGDGVGRIGLESAGRADTSLHVRREGDRAVAVRGDARRRAPETSPE